jgi:hypothetical protein
MAPNASWKLNYLLEERTESGAASLVAGLYCDVVSNAPIVVIQGVILQDGKLFFVYDVGG